MTEVVQQRRGWCPTVWAPMASGDGIIVRVHSGGRPLRFEAARLLAELAARHGNGLIDLTRRANVQLRGLAEVAVAEVQARLSAGGLAPVGAERERQLNMLVSPRAGLDPACAPLDELYRAVRDRMLELAPAARLSAKFSLVLDGDDGDLARVSSDVRVRVTPAEREHALVYVAEDVGEACLGAVPCARAPQVVAGLVRLLGELPGADVRMRDLVRLRGLSALRAALGVRGCDAPAPSPARPWLGAQQGERAWLGVAVPFGSAQVVAWRAAAGVAESLGSGELRVTPARGLLIPDVSAKDAPRALSVLREAGFLVEHGDARLYAVACTGAPGCQAALGDTRALASELACTLATQLGPERLLHVSGCAKSCAHTGRAALTVLLDEAGAKVAQEASVARAALADTVTLAELRRSLAAHAYGRSATGAPPRAQRERDDGS